MHEEKAIFLNNGKELFAFLPALTSALMVQKQWWKQLLAPSHQSRPWHNCTPSHCILPAMHSQLKRNSILTKECLWWSNNSDFIKSWPFMIFCVAQWGVWNMNHLCCIPRQCLSQGIPAATAGAQSWMNYLLFFFFPPCISIFIWRTIQTMVMQT